MGLLRAYIKSVVTPPKKPPRRFYGQVVNASGVLIWRCDCNHRSLTAATRCGRTEAAYLSRHPEQMAQLKPLSWLQRHR
jgi:hypothetical protein